MQRPTIVRGAIFLATVVAAWGVLSLGAVESEEPLVVGELAQRTYTAEREAEVEDTAATEAARQEAWDGISDEYRLAPEVQDAVRADINGVFDDLEASVLVVPLPTPPTTAPEATVTTPPEADPGTEDTTTTLPPLPSQLLGVVFIDVDENGLFEPDAEAERVDKGIEGVAVQIDVSGEIETVTTGIGGVWTLEVVTGANVAIVNVDYTDDAIPVGYTPGSEDIRQEIACAEAEQCLTTPVGFVVNLVPAAEIAESISSTHLVAFDAALPLALTASDDVVRVALGDSPRLPIARTASIARANQEFGLQIRSEQMTETRQRIRTSPPVIFYGDLPPESVKDTMDSEAAAAVVATFIQPNYLIDATETERLRQAAADAVEPVVVTYTTDHKIVEEGVPLTQLDIDAIGQTTSLVTAVQGESGLLAVLAVLVGLLGLYLATFRPEFWSRPRMVALLGILLVLAAAAVRGTVVLQEATSWYVLPAVAFGFVTAVLFDSRIAVLMALSVGVLAAVGARDTGLAVYAILATMAPIPFVSSVSSRGAFRKAVLYSSMAAAVVAAATSWFFHATPEDVPVEVFGVSVNIPLEFIGTSMLWAFTISVVASLIGLAALQFFESAFDITTSLSLLDLTDRNHKALQLLQEQAFGTFNHSLMVGTLSHAAARAIGANALLARAMAYYHDLGKTENPTYFIENQFGIPNPHDQLTPKESAEVIRSHVSDGVSLARKFKIPSDVASGIVSHHGDGVMRYFYETARTESGEDVDVDDFRHIGHKPRTAESAILMMADSLEAACRAVFQTEEPTPDAIEKVVNRVIDEKIEDGQLRESPLTLGELTQIREAFLESLVGHYHQRIAYPNFPGS